LPDDAGLALPGFEGSTFKGEGLVGRDFLNVLYASAASSHSGLSGRSTLL
jgi:hypothetical protein